MRELNNEGETVTGDSILIHIPTDGEHKSLVSNKLLFSMLFFTPQWLWVWCYVTAWPLYECTKISVQVASTTALAFGGPLYDKIPYHTSALLRLDWSNNGHPEWIQNELEVHKHVFAALLNKLRAMGFGSSWNITCEEQLAIFLYTYVTGLSIWHISKRQHTMMIISQSVSTLDRYLDNINESNYIAIFSRC